MMPGVMSFRADIGLFLWILAHQFFPPLSVFSIPIAFGFSANIIDVALSDGDSGSSDSFLKPTRRLSGGDLSDAIDLALS